MFSLPLFYLFRLSFGQVKGYVMKNWRTLTSPGQPMPAYIQLDHVYGLSGFDLNISRLPPRAKRPLKQSPCSNPAPALNPSLAPSPAPTPRLMIALDGLTRCLDSDGMHPPLRASSPWIYG